MLSYQQALLEATERLKQAKSITPKIDALLLLCAATKKDKIHVYTYLNTILGIDDYDAFERLVARREKGEPIAYILGYKPFWDADFNVTPGVLIPRPDTETLITAVLENIAEKQQKLHICDLGTGSGAIALTLAQNLPNSALTAVDISPKALKCARINAHKLDVLARVNFIESAWFEQIPPCRFDGIVSNPPYIPAVDIQNLMRDVRDYEPHLALDGGPDGLREYRTILKDVPHYLNKGGFIAFEVGFDQAQDVVTLLEQTNIFIEIKTYTDLQNIERVVFARRGLEK